MFWGRRLYYNLSLTSKRGESCKRRMRSPLRCGILPPPSLLATSTKTVVSLFPHPSGCTSPLLPSSWVYCLSSPLKAGLASQTISKLMQGKKACCFPRCCFSGLRWTARKLYKHHCTRKNKMERYKIKAGCESVLNSTKLHSLSLQQGMRALLWTSASWVFADGISYRRKPVLVQKRVFDPFSQSFFPF